jgi:hypothetical protein
MIATIHSHLIHRRIWVPRTPRPSSGWSSARRPPYDAGVETGIALAPDLGAYAQVAELPERRVCLSSRLDRWRRRNGIGLSRPGWPGIVHQSWGWYDSLPNVQAALVTAAAVLFVAATSMYLFTVSAAMRPMTAAAAPPQPRVSSASTRVPAAVPTPAPTLGANRGLRSVVTLPAALRLRAQPGTDAVALRELPANTRLDLLGETAVANGFLWMHVRTADGATGWVIENGVE